MAVGSGAMDGGEGEGNGVGDAERQLLEKELHEAECTLLGEVQQIERLGEENVKKVEELRGLKDDVKLLQERNEYDLSMLQDEHTSAQQELAHGLSVLREQLAQLKLKHARYKEAAHLSEVSGAGVETLLTKMEQRTKTHGAEVHATRQEVLHVRKALESTFRKTLKDLEGTYRRKAYNALGKKAKAGMRTNKMLREEMALQEVGVVALCKGHAEQCQKAEQLRGELTDLKRFEEGHKAALADLQREGRTNRCYYADIQETKSKIAAAEQSLRRDLAKEGVPICSVAELREMAKKEREEGQRMEKLKEVWDSRAQELTRAVFQSSTAPRLPASPNSGTGSLGSAYSSASHPIASSGDESLGDGKLRGSKSAPPGQCFLGGSDGREESTGICGGGSCNGKGVTTGWKARVRQVVKGWADVDDFGDGLRPTLALSSTRSLVLRKKRALDKAHGGAQRRENLQDPLTARDRRARLEGNRSASLSALGTASSALQQLQDRPSRGPGEVPKQTSPTLLGSASATNFRVVCEEDPWEIKRRMERGARRRDAELRAKAFAVNQRGASCRQKGQLGQ